MIQGSVEFGGKQPNYLIDSSHPIVQSFLQQVRSKTTSLKTPWAIIDRVTVEVRKQFPANSYDNPRQTRLNAKYVENGGEVPFSEYLRVRAGTCREHAIATQIALKALGFESKYLYVKAPALKDKSVLEDHAVVVVQLNGESWVVDSYAKRFHRARLSELLQGNDLGRFFPTDYPTVLVPNEPVGK